MSHSQIVRRAEIRGDHCRLFAVGDPWQLSVRVVRGWRAAGASGIDGIDVDARHGWADGRGINVDGACPALNGDDNTLYSSRTVSRRQH